MVHKSVVTVKKLIFGSLGFILDTLTLLYRLVILCSKMDKQVDGVPSLHITAFIHVLHTGLCSSPRLAQLSRQQ